MRYYVNSESGNVEDMHWVDRHERSKSQLQ